MKICNIWSHPVTTMIGIVFILAGIASVFSGNATWTEALLVISIGLPFLGLKDPKFPNINNNDKE